jgi:hypothetical protein
MKEVFKQAFSWEILKPFTFGFGSVLLLEFIIFPGLTIANTIINLISGTLLIGLIIFTANYIFGVGKKKTESGVIEIVEKPDVVKMDAKPKSEK